MNKLPYFIVVALAMLSLSACHNTSGAPSNGPTSAPTTTNTLQPIASSPAANPVAPEPASTQSDSPTLSDAINALKKMAENSNDSALKARLADFAKQPERSSDAPLGNGDCYRFGVYWEIRLYNCTWMVRVTSDTDGTWLYYGDLRKDKNAEWEAVETSRRGQGSRGG